MGFLSAMTAIAVVFVKLLPVYSKEYKKNLCSGTQYDTILKTNTCSIFWKLIENIKKGICRLSSLFNFLFGQYRKLAYGVHGYRNGLLCYRFYDND